MAREKRNPDSCRKLIRVVQELDAFLEQQGYLSPLDLNSSILETFIGLKSNPSTIQERRRFIAYAINLWKEEEWLNIDYVGSKYKYPKSNIDVIPEETLVQIYNNLELFPAPLERLFRLQIALGWRICEMIMLPRNCLKFEREQWYTKRWIAKRKVYKFHPIHHLIVEVINEQQRFINNELGTNSDFDKLFCWMSAALGDGAEQSKKGGAKQLDKNLTRFEIDPVYEAKIFNTQSIRFWLRGFSKLAKLQDKDGKSFQLTSHMFRRTKASIMAHCEAEDEYIAAVLGHSSLSMLPHYRQRSLEKLEKLASEKGYIDKYGELTTFKPRKTNSEKLTTLMKVSTPLCECHRARMLGDCQHKYACLNCIHHRVTLDDILLLENDLSNLQTDLSQAEPEGADRRIIQINELMKLIKVRLNGLQKLLQLIKK